MIHDKNKDFLYLADTLPLKHPKFYNEFRKFLEENKIIFKLLPGTKDIWCRDYMPVQNGLGELIRFKYQPDYLKAKKYSSTISDVGKICRSIKVKTVRNELIVDGGNIIHCGSNVIMCDKILSANKKFTRAEINLRLRDALRVNNILFIPTHPDDICGHADGVIRFLDKRTVLINDFRKESPQYRKELLSSLRKYNLKWIEVPYNTTKNKTSFDATGIYINFLQMKGIIFLPVYGLEEDIEVIKLFTKLFKGEKIIPVKCNSIAKEGGVLNCISWTIKSNYPKVLSEYEKEVERDLLNLGLEFYPDLNQPS